MRALSFLFDYFLKNKDLGNMYFLFYKECKIIFFQNRSPLKEYLIFLAPCTSFPSPRMKPYEGYNIHASYACLKP